MIGPHDSDLEHILIAMSVVYGCSIFANTPSWIDYLADERSAGIQIGKRLFANGQLQQWKEEGKAIPFILDQLIRLLPTTKNSDE